jgi:hypothetical protein
MFSVDDKAARFLLEAQGELLGKCNRTSTSA